MTVGGNGLFTALRVLSLYTFYLSYAVMLAHGLALILTHKLPRARLAKWFVSMVLSSLMFVPFMAVLTANQRGGPRHRRFLQKHSRGILAALYSGYSFSVGETLFSWMPVACPAVLAMLAVVLLGVRMLRQHRTASCYRF